MASTALPLTLSRVVMASKSENTEDDIKQTVKQAPKTGAKRKKRTDEDAASEPKRHKLDNQERAYVAASRRSDRSIEARMESARRASEVHFLKNGRHLKVTEESVMKLEMYEEEEKGITERMSNLARHLSYQQPLTINGNRALEEYLSQQAGTRAIFQLQAFQGQAQGLQTPGARQRQFSQHMHPQQYQLIQHQPVGQFQQHVSPVGPPAQYQPHLHHPGFPSYIPQVQYGLPMQARQQMSSFAPPFSPHQQHMSLSAPPFSPHQQHMSPGAYSQPPPHQPTARVAQPYYLHPQPPKSGHPTPQNVAPNPYHRRSLQGHDPTLVKSSVARSRSASPSPQRGDLRTPDLHPSESASLVRDQQPSGSSSQHMPESKPAEALPTTGESSTAIEGPGAEVATAQQEYSNQYSPVASSHSATPYFLDQYVDDMDNSPEPQPAQAHRPSSPLSAHLQKYFDENSPLDLALLPNQQQLVGDRLKHSNHPLSSSLMAGNETIPMPNQPAINNDDLKKEQALEFSIQQPSIQQNGEDIQSHISAFDDELFKSSFHNFNSYSLDDSNGDFVFQDFFNMDEFTTT